MQPATGTNTDTRLPDFELVSRVAGGDHDAFRLIMRRHNQMLYRAARSILKDDAEAEDAVQEAYLLAYRGMVKFRGDAKLSTWLVRIVVNEAIARLRKRNRSVEVIQLDDEVKPEHEAAKVNMDGAELEQPERAALRLQTRRLLESKINGLPDAFRAVFVLRAIEEMSVEEVAAMLGVPEATVRTRFFRAKSLLREALSRIDLTFDDVFAFAGTRCDRIVTGVMAKLDLASVG